MHLITLTFCMLVNIHFQKNNRYKFLESYRGILVYNIYLISISNSVSDGATNKSISPVLWFLVKSRLHCMYA